MNVGSWFMWCMCIGNVLSAEIWSYEAGGRHLAFITFVGMASGFWMGIAAEQATGKKED